MVIHKKGSAILSSLILSEVDIDETDNQYRKNMHKINILNFRRAKITYFCDDTTVYSLNMASQHRRVKIHMGRDKK